MANGFGMADIMSAEPPARRPGRGHRFVGAGAVAAALLTAGCASTPDATSPAVTAASLVQPPTVEGHLTSSARREPYTRAELADPGVRSFVEACERAGAQACGERWITDGRRQSFALASDPVVMARFKLGGLRPRQTYVAACHFIDPSGSLVRATSSAFPAPKRTDSGDVVTHTCSMALAPTSATGAWTVRYIVNGKEVLALRFEVTAAGERSI